VNIIIDTGPLYAFFDSNDQWNRWIIETFAEIDPPFLTCEAVITETTFLLKRNGIPLYGLFQLIERKDLIITPVFNTQKSQHYIRSFIDTYHDLPASFADACLVYMVETQKDSKILTLDSDFSIYRNSKGQPLPLISPDLRT